MEVQIRQTYDALGRVLTKTYPDGGVEKWAYSALGVTKYTNQLGFVTSYGYDLEGRVTAVTNANSEVTRTIYDWAGNVSQLIDGKNQTNWFYYDSLGRLTNHTDAATNIVLTNSFDMAGNLIERWTPAKGKTVYSYDASRNLTNINYPTSTDVRFSYDALNRLSTMTDEIGTTTFGYTDNGELAYEDGPWQDDTVSYSYTNGLRATMTLLQPSASPWVVSYGYRGDNQLETMSTPLSVFTWTYQNYDASSQKGSLIKKLAYPNGTYVTNTFNNMAQMLSTFYKNSSHATLNSHSYTYNTGFQKTRQTRTAGDYVDYTYDNIGQLKSAIGKESGGTSRLNEQFGYAYDAAHNLQYRTNNALVQTFNVNSRNQLTSISRSGTLTVIGNTTTNASTVTVNGNAATIYGDLTFAKSGLTLVDGTNTFTAVGSDANGRGDTNTVTVKLPASVSINYDANGNLTAEGDRTYSYSDDNRLTSVLMTNVWKEEFFYDGLSRRRIEKEYTWQNSAWVLKSERRVFYDGLTPLALRNGDNAPLLNFLRSDALLLGSRDGNTPNDAFHGADANENLTARTGSAQSLNAQYTYGAYGILIAKREIGKGEGTEFSSQRRGVQSLLDLFAYREYNQSIQRWTTLDPLIFIDGLNNYTYVQNDPINKDDSLGRTARWILRPTRNSLNEPWVINLDAHLKISFYGASDYTLSQKIQMLWGAVTVWNYIPAGSPDILAKIGVYNVKVKLNVFIDEVDYTSRSHLSDPTWNTIWSSTENFGQGISPVGFGVSFAGVLGGEPHNLFNNFITAIP